MPDFDILVAARRDLLHQDDDPVNVRSSRVSSSEQPPTRAAQRESELGFPRGRSSRPLGGASSNSASASPQQRAAVGSLSRDSSVRPLASRESSISRAEGIRKRLSTPFFPSGPPETTPKTKTEQPAQPTKEGEEEDNNNNNQQQQQQQPTENRNETESAVGDESSPSATLGHVLTNVIILYEFLLELSATVQVRGSLYEEAGYPGVGVEESV